MRGAQDAGRGCGTYNCLGSGKRAAYRHQTPLPTADASRLRFKLAQENDDTAEVYDEKWAAYTAETVAFSLSQLPQLPEGARVLDLACGTGAMLRALASPDSRQPPLGEYVGLDNSAAMLRRAEAACSGPACAAAVPRRWLHCPADAPLPLPDAHFDAVVTANSFHFFGDRETSLREAARVLKPGGTLLVADWCADYLSCQLLELYLRLVGRPTAPVLRAAQLRGLVEGVGSLEVVEESDKLVRAWWGFMCLRARKRG